MFVITFFIILTLEYVAQLSTHHNGIRASPGVITHSTPLIVYADLHSAFICHITSCQSQLTICTWSCSNALENGTYTIKANTFKLFKCVLQMLEIHLPLQFTPASSEWRQLCDRIGLLTHSRSWLALVVHWTSSRKIGPLPAPKWALLYAVPPVVCKTI